MKPSDNFKELLSKSFFIPNKIQKVELAKLSQFVIGEEHVFERTKNQN